MSHYSERPVSNPSFNHSLEIVRNTILSSIIRYDGAKDTQGKQETVLDHVNDMKKLSAHIRKSYHHLKKAINFDEVDIMADIHDSGEANKYGDLSRGNPDYNRLRDQYDRYEEEHKRDYVFPLFSSADRTYVEQLDQRFERRDELGDKEGLMTRVLDKAQPLAIFERGFIVNTLKALPQYAQLSPQEFDQVLRAQLIEAFTLFLEPGKRLIDLLASDSAAQQELLFFIENDMLSPMVKRGYENEVQAAKEKVLGRQQTRRRSLAM